MAGRHSRHSAVDPSSSGGLMNNIRRRFTNFGGGQVEEAEADTEDDGMFNEDAADGPDTPRKKSAVFIDAEAMKEKVRANLAMDKRQTCYQYKETGVCAYIAKHVLFERAMLAVIAMNAIWIAVDTDYNTAEVLITAHPVFQVAENLFCAAFSFEWIIRFISFQKKSYAFKDTWFMFDTFMVVMMVLETWVMTAYLLLSSGSSGGSGLGNSSILKMARLMRLSRMARMARLLRAMPELMIMVKGMITAVRSVVITLTLLILIMYGFGIAFCQMTRESDIGQRHFPYVLDSMYTLGIHGTLLDNIKYLSDELGKESPVLSAFFYLYVLLTAFTVMNMLIGVLVEVVSAVAATEREEILVTYVKSKVLKVVEEIDQDGDRHITKAEMVGILENASACRALKEVGVDVMSLVDNQDAIFVDVKGRELDQLSFADFMNVVLSLRGTNNATVKDIVELRKSLRAMNQDIVANFKPLMRQMQRLLQELRPSMPRSHSMGAVPTGGLLQAHSAVHSELDRAQTMNMTFGGVDLKPSKVMSAPPEPNSPLGALAPSAAERIDLEGSWCPFSEARGPEAPELMPTKPQGGQALLSRRTSLQIPPRGTSPLKSPRAACSPRLSPAPARPAPALCSPAERGDWCELPEVVPEERSECMEIPERPPPEREPSRLLGLSQGQGHLRPPPMPLEEATWHEIPPDAGIPAPELVGPQPEFPVSHRPPELPNLAVPDFPDRRPAFDAPSPCKCFKSPDTPSFHPSVHLVCRGVAEPGFEDASEATCTPGSAEDSRLGIRLPPLAETGSFCPVGAAELRSHMAELTKSLTAGLCQVKRLEERLRQPLCAPSQPSCAPTSLPPVPTIGIQAPSVDLE